MKGRLTLFLLVGVALLAAYWFLNPTSSPSVSRGSLTQVTKGPLAVFSVYEGKLDTRRAVIIMSKFQGNATVVELAPEEARVRRGDVLVRFNSSAIEREVLKLERDYTLAKSELDILRQAKLPLEIRDLEIKLMKAQSALTAEQQYLETILHLAKEDLISEPEIKQQKMKVSEVTTQLKTLELQMKSTKEHLHPSVVKHAQAKVSAAEQELKLAREQLQNCLIRSPADGIVAYKPIPIGTEFRAVRVGDTVYPNQPFMVLPDMSDLVVHCDIPESELSRVQRGKEVYLQPLAYPDLRLRGQVETVGSLAQAKPEQPQWQRFFRVVVGLKEMDTRLRPGMSLSTHILSYYHPQVSQIPRQAVHWEGGNPLVKVLKGNSREVRPIKVGLANEKNYQVLEGVKPGDRVFLE
jgi:multidrug resistance efflux pump